MDAITELREVVAVVLTWRDKIGLFKRSPDAAFDPGRWHCLSSDLNGGESPTERALIGLFRETGLGVVDLSRLATGPVLELSCDGPGNTRIHTFLAATERRVLSLDRTAHDSYRWVTPSRLSRFDGQVTWLQHVTRAVAEIAPAR